MRKIIDIVKPEKGVDGAGVHLYHVLGRNTMHDTDPLLLLDAFDATDPNLYEAGFPMHPHRGLETISYVYKGTMVHKDSLGNEDAVNDGEVQWMTAGSGIFHEEMMPPVEKLYGVQLWLNLKSDDKFVKPEYFAISKDDIKEIKFENGYLRLLAGDYKDQHGFKSKHQPVNYYDIHINPKSSFELDLEDDDSLTLFALIGDFTVKDKTVKKFHAALVERKGDKILIENKTDKKIAVLAFISKRIDEPIAWTPGPIVMNSQKELDEAYEEVKNGTFIKDDIAINK